MVTFLVLLFYVFLFLVVFELDGEDVVERDEERVDQEVDQANFWLDAEQGGAAL